MNITIRMERPADFSATENLTREAFYNVHGPGCDEHYLLHVMHASDALIPELNLVAVLEGEIVGNVICTRAKVAGDAREWADVLCLGPIGVLPAYQRQGIGGALIRAAASQAAEMGFRAILLYGNPAYYGKQGFVPAERYGICTPDDMYADALQAMELTPGALDGVKGRFFEDPIYEVDPVASAEFEAGFPEKAKLEGMPSQLEFMDIVRRRRAVK